MGRAPCCDKDGITKGPWTPEEDQKLVEYIQKHGDGNWRTLPKNAGLKRCGKSCRLRWTNYLRPDIKRGRFSFEEEETIVQLHSILGNKWSAIAARLPGRTDNEIKNYWNTHIKKRLLRMGIDPITHSPRLDLLDLSTIFNPSAYNYNPNLSRLIGLQQLVNPEILNLARSLLFNSSTTSQQDPNTFPLQNQQYTLNDQIQTTPLSNMQETPCTASTPAPCIPSSSHVINPGFDSQSFEPQTQGFSQMMNEWPTNGTNYPSAADHLPHLSDLDVDDYIASYNSVYDTENSALQSNNLGFGFSSMLSTKSSSQTPLNSTSNSMDINNEDERESYCSNLIKFEIPADILDINEFM